MKKAIFLVLGLLTMSSILMTACGGDDDDDDVAEAADQNADEAPELVDPPQEDSEDDGSIEQDGPPALALTQGDNELAGELGNAMWTTDDGGSYVADAFAIISLAEAHSFAAAPATLVVSDPPYTGGTVTIFALDGGIEPETIPGSDKLRWVPLNAGDAEAAQPETVEIGADGALDLSALAPGEYLVSFFGNWEEGYGEYGFYIEIA